MKDNLYFGYDIVGAAEFMHRQDNYTFKTSNTLMDNMTRKAELDLFERNFPIDALGTAEPAHDINIPLTVFQKKVMLALAKWLSSHLNEDAVKKHVERVTETYLVNRREGMVTTTDLVTCMVHIPTLAKEIYGEGRLGGTEKRKVREALTQLSTMRQSVTFGKERGITISAPMISLGEEVEINYGKKRVPAYINVRFEDIFLYQINSQYALLPCTFLDLWRESGVKSELFSTLVLLLVQRRGIFVSKMNEKLEEFKKESEKAKKTNDRTETEMAELKRKLLTYSEGIYSILDRLDVNKYVYKQGARKGKVRSELLKEDIKRAVVGLRMMGIISDYYETSAADGSILCNFVFNDDWIRNEKAKMKRLK